MVHDEIVLPFWYILILVFLLCIGEIRHEVVGEVVEVGPDVRKFDVGDIVGVGLLVGCCNSCSPCEAEVEQYCKKKIWTYNDVYTDGIPTQGGFSGSMVVHQK